MKRDQDTLTNEKSGHLSDKKSWFLFILQMQFLILSLLLILWGKKKLSSFSERSTPTVERKAEFIAPKKDLKDLKEP